MRIVHNATVITPRGDEVLTLREHSLVFDDQRVVELAPAAGFQRRIDAGEFDEVIAGDRHVVIPGLINTHHHLYQSLTRCLPAVQNEPLFNWLLGLYERWRHLDYKAVNIAAKVSIAELLLHGCTTTSDHNYMVPRDSDVKMEAVLDAAEELGIRIHLCRGSMTLGKSHGGLPPDDCVEDDAAVLADCQRMLDTFHDPSEYAMRRIDLAPCSPFNCTRELLRDTVVMARERGGVLLHTHLAETLDEQRYCLEHYNCRPVRFLEDLDFLGPDVYLAHCVYLNDEEIELFAKTRTGVSHNPTSNMRLASGIAPIEKMLRAGVRVGLGVDGSSSNDGGNLLGEAKQALLSARVSCALQFARETGEPNAARDTDAVESALGGNETSNLKSKISDIKSQVSNLTSQISNLKSQISNPESVPPMMPVSDAFGLATGGGAACLNRSVLGHLNPGAAADFAMFRTDDIALAGGYAQDPLAALMLCAVPRADRVYVAGREVVRDARVVAIDEGKLADEMNALVSARFTGK